MDIIVIVSRFPQQTFLRYLFLDLWDDKEEEEDADTNSNYLLTSDLPWGVAKIGRKVNCTKTAGVSTTTTFDNKINSLLLHTFVISDVEISPANLHSLHRAGGKTVWLLDILIGSQLDL